MLEVDELFVGRLYVASFELLKLERLVQEVLVKHLGSVHSHVLLQNLVLLRLSVRSHRLCRHEGDLLWDARNSR